MFQGRVFASGAIASQASGAPTAWIVHRRPVGAMCRGYRKPRMASGAEPRRESPPRGDEVPTHRGRAGFPSLPGRGPLSARL